VDLGNGDGTIYLAHDRGLPFTSGSTEDPAAQSGRLLTAWELGHHGAPHTVIPDKHRRHLMQHRMVDLAIVGTTALLPGRCLQQDRTYLKALAAHMTTACRSMLSSIADHRL